MPSPGHDIGFKTGTQAAFDAIIPDDNTFYCVINNETDEVSFYIGSAKIGSTFIDTTPWKYNEDYDSFEWASTTKPPQFFVDSNTTNFLMFSQEDQHGVYSFSLDPFAQGPVLSAGNGDVDITTLVISNINQYSKLLINYPESQFNTDKKRYGSTFLIHSTLDTDPLTSAKSKLLRYLFGTGYLNGESLDSLYTFNPTTFDKNVIDEYKAVTYSSNDPKRGEFIVRYYDLFKVLDHMLEKFTVSYDLLTSEYHDETIVPQTISNGIHTRDNSLIVTNIIPTHDWRLFDYWLGSDGNHYDPMSYINTNADVTLSAVWKQRWAQINYGLTGFTNASEFPIQFRDVRYDLRLNDTLPIPSDATEVFMGWYLDDKCVYYPGRIWDNDSGFYATNIYRGTAESISLFAYKGTGYNLTFKYTYNNQEYTQTYKIANNMRYAAAIADLANPCNLPSGATLPTHWIVQDGPAVGYDLTYTTMLTQTYGLTSDATVIGELTL